jgi:uncharacterized RDD family membrane protein YckC
MPEEWKRAGFLLRTIAKILDFLIIAAAVEIVPKAGFFAGLAYLLVGDGLPGGSSLGKKLMGIKVISTETNAPCSFRDSILRNSILGAGYLLFRIPWIGWIFIVIASVLEGVVLLGSRDGKRLGDEIAGTAVIESSRTQGKDSSDVSPSSGE